MFIHSLNLQNFRNYKKQSFEFGDTTLVIGPNATGKSNLLEAIYLLSFGRSFKDGPVSEIISRGQDFSRIKGGADELDLEILLTRGEIGGQPTALKKLTVNGVSKRLFSFTGNLRLVLFKPADLDIVNGPPGQRREYLDEAIGQISRDYVRAMINYEKGLRQRNKLLELVRENLRDKDELEYWNSLLVENGRIITQSREAYIAFINQWQNKLIDTEVFYDKSPITYPRLMEYKEAEIASGQTLVGPQRDDLQFNSKVLGNGESLDLKIYGSRGQQRLTVLQLKICQLDYIAKYANERPVLLLDDIFSELDVAHRELATSVIDKQQTIVTAADKGLVPERKWGKKINLA